MNAGAVAIGGDSVVPVSSRRGIKFGRRVAEWLVSLRYSASKHVRTLVESIKFSVFFSPTFNEKETNMLKLRFNYDSISFENKNDSLASKSD